MHWSRGTWQLSPHHTNNTEHCSLSYSENLSLQHSSLNTGCNPYYPGRETSKEMFLMSLNGRNQKHSFTIRLAGVRGLGLSWTKLWRIQVLLHIKGGQRPMSPEVPLQLMVLWVCGSGCGQLKKEKSRLWLLKNCTEVKLKQGNSWSWEQQEVTVPQQILQINTGDEKAKSKRAKTPFQNPTWSNWVSHKASYKVKISFKVTPSPKLSCGSYFEHLLSLVVVKVSKNSPWSSSADVSGCTGTEELQWGARGPAHSKCMAVPPFSASTKDLGMTWEL